MKSKQKYSIGLDIGTASVGWACMNQDFQLLKRNGRYAIGVHEFEAAETAESRRLKRGGRRRYNRRIKRIQLLQETMQPLFGSDQNFIPGLNHKSTHFWRNNNDFEGKSLSETLQELGENTRKYPTIYHLRHALVQSKERMDPKLIYLAVHNLTKYRGHFLSGNKGWGSGDAGASIESILMEFLTELALAGGVVKNIDESVLGEICRIIEDDLTKSDKQKQVTNIIGKEFKVPIGLILGLKANLAELFIDSNNKETYKENKESIDFTLEGAENTAAILTTEEQNVIEIAEQIYQSFTLKALLGDANYVSEAKVATYDQFNKDLKELQSIYNAFYDRKAYRETFITSRSNGTKYKKTKNPKLLCEFDKFLKLKKDHEDVFYTKVKKKIEDTIKQGNLSNVKYERLKSIVTRIDEGVFLQKQKGRMNAAIPHQNNLYEARKILKGQQTFYPEITDEMIGRVEQIIGFRIPYYIGPLVKEKNPAFGWLERKDDVKNITPWNFEEVIDKSESAEKFITKMTGYCTYLPKKMVLPKNSLIYQKFELLNELNGVQIRKSNENPNRKYRLDTAEKDWLLKNVFQKTKSVTTKKVVDELRKSPYKDIVIDVETESLKKVFGTQQESKFATSLSSYIDMERIFGDLEGIDMKMLEKIIYWLTVFTEEEIIRLKIKEYYPSVTSTQINQLTKLNYSGWGRLSEKLIDGIRLSETNQETIIGTMQKENKLFMEILHEEKYELEKKIELENAKEDKGITKIKYSDVAELQGSPAIKRGIWRAILIIEELVSIFGEPEHIMLEFAREDQESKRTKSKLEQWKEIMNAIPAKEEKELKAFLRSETKQPESKYNENRFLLYLSQQGKCMYSGETLDLNELSNYEVDHILPRSFVKDDSIDNLALVKQRLNQQKQDTKMPLELIPLTKRMERISHWKKLYDNNMISSKKYHLLLKERFTDQDKESFFARQLVETRQIIKHVGGLLEERFSKTEIHPLKAGFISKFRKHADILKIREYNNKHHAVDAALGLVILQFIIKKYGRNFLTFDFKYQEAREKWSQAFLRNSEDFFLFADIDKYDQFKSYKDASQLTSARQYLTALNDEIPWQTTKKTGSNESAFYDETIYSPVTEKAKYQSVKTSIGIHKAMKNECSYIVSYMYKNAKGKEIYENKIIDFYVIEKYQLGDVDGNELALHLARRITKGTVIKANILGIILKHQAVIYNDFPFYFISGEKDEQRSSGELHNAKQLVLNAEIMKEYHSFSKMDDEELRDNISLVRSHFQKVSDEVIDQYRPFLSETVIQKMRSYENEKLKCKKSYNTGMIGLFNLTKAGANQSKLFGRRYQKSLKPEYLNIVNESITGLHYRKPKSFKKDLW